MSREKATTQMHDGVAADPSKRTVIVTAPEGAAGWINAADGSVGLHFAILVGEEWRTACGAKIHMRDVYGLLIPSEPEGAIGDFFNCDECLDAIGADVPEITFQIGLDDEERH